ncbi:hypothetical protein FB107DRAFT_204685 [Schizophyllum commune]
MSSKGVTGTQSPSLEATGEQVPMGASSVNSVGKDIPVVNDEKDQRGAYFEESKTGASEATSKPKRQMKSESLAQKFEDDPSARGRLD